MPLAALASAKCPCIAAVTHFIVEDAAYSRKVRPVTGRGGPIPGDTWSGAEVTYTRLDCRGGSVTVTLQSDPGLFTAPQRVTAVVGGRAVARAAVPPRGVTALTARLRPSGSTCTARFVVAHTLVPRDVTHGANPDPRRLGLHFNAFGYHQP